MILDPARPYKCSLPLLAGCQSLQWGPHSLPNSLPAYLQHELASVSAVRQATQCLVARLTEGRPE